MIHIQAKRYQLTLWLASDRSGAALRQEFNDRNEAETAFRQHRAGQTYRAGILYEWSGVHQDWTLLSHYP